MSDSNWFEVTVSRINESANKAPYETFSGHTLKIGPDGSLTVTWEGGSHGFSAGTYDSFEFKRLRVPTRKS
jgi:hypothetical protein